MIFWQYFGPGSGCARVHSSQGKWQKNPCQGKHREFGNLAKTQGILCAPVQNSLILKIKDILLFLQHFPIFSSEMKVSGKSVFVYEMSSNH